MRRYPGSRPGYAALRVLVVFAAAAAGCTTMQAVEQPSAERMIDPGDTVFVSVQDGRRLELEFAEWTAEALSGSEVSSGILQRIRNETIDRVEVEKYSVLMNVGLGVVILAMGAAIGADAFERGLDY